MPGSIQFLKVDKTGYIHGGSVAFCHILLHIFYPIMHFGDREREKRACLLFQVSVNTMLTMPCVLCHVLNLKSNLERKHLPLASYKTSHGMSTVNLTFVKEKSSKKHLNYQLLSPVYVYNMAHMESVTGLFLSSFFLRISN